MKRQGLLLLMLIGSLACTPAVREAEVATAVLPAAPSPTAIAAATAVPTQIIAPTPTLPPTDTPLPTEMPPTNTPFATDIPPTKSPRATATVTIEAVQTYTVSANGVQFVLDGRIAPAVYPRLSDGDLHYREFAFAPEGFCRDIGCVTIYEVASFRQEIPGGDFILDELVASLAADINDNIPTWGAAILLQAQEKLLPFPSGFGVRAVVMRGQDGFWANNEAIVYNFHGVTEDGRYYINVTIPIDAAILMDGFDPDQNSNPNALPMPELAAEPNEVVAQIAQYNAAAADQLDALPPTDFMPNLVLLDELVASLVINE